MREQALHEAKSYFVDFVKHLDSDTLLFDDPKILADRFNTLVTIPLQFFLDQQYITVKHAEVLRESARKILLEKIEASQNEMLTRILWNGYKIFVERHSLFTEVFFNLVCMVLKKYETACVAILQTMQRSEDELQTLTHTVIQNSILQAIQSEIIAGRISDCPNNIANLWHFYKKLYPDQYSQEEIECYIQTAKTEAAVIEFQGIANQLFSLDDKTLDPLYESYQVNRLFTRDQNVEHIGKLKAYVEALEEDAFLPLDALSANKPEGLDGKLAQQWQRIHWLHQSGLLKPPTTNTPTQHCAR